MRRSAVCLFCAVAALAPTAHADYAPRGVLAPSSRDPAAVTAGQKLSMIVRVASGLTPPPGVQTERALRGFAARVCAADECVSLPVRNVRPTDAHSFVYRVEAPLPATLEPGSYDLDLRYPGGNARVAAAVRVTPAQKSAEVSAPPPPSGCSITPGASPPTFRGLLALGLSWKLAARRRRPSRAGNTPSRTPVSDWS